MTDTEIDNLCKVITLCCRIIVRIGRAMQNRDSLNEETISTDIKTTLKKIK